MAVVGSGIAAVRRSPDDAGLQLLENSLVTGAALVALILALQPVSASFNPVVTWVERALGRVDSRTAAVLSAAQVAGGVVGVVLANLMFDLAAVELSTTRRTGADLWLAEVVATFGLVVVVFGSLRTGRPSSVAVAVGAYITAAYWFTSSTSFANPAVTVARTLSDTFAGIAPASAPAFLACQLSVVSSAGSAVRVPVPRAEGDDPMTDKPSVLFVCVHNAGRSQMAAAYLEHLSGGRVEVLSAGSAPADSLNPVVVEAMLEEGIDLGSATPKILTDEAVAGSDVVVTMGCGDACPFFPGKRYEDWSLDDPAGQGLEAVRPIRDEIRRRVQALVDELLV